MSEGRGRGAKGRGRCSVVATKLIPFDPILALSLLCPVNVLKSREESEDGGEDVDEDVGEDVDVLRTREDEKWKSPREF